MRLSSVPRSPPDLDSLQTEGIGQDDQEDHMSFGDEGDDQSDSADSEANLDGDTSEDASDSNESMKHQHSIA